MAGLTRLAPRPLELSSAPACHSHKSGPSPATETVQVMIAHEVADAIPYEKNPVRRVCYDRETLRRRLDRPDDSFGAR